MTYAGSAAIAVLNPCAANNYGYLYDVPSRPLFSLAYGRSEIPIPLQKAPR